MRTWLMTAAQTALFRRPAPGFHFDRLSTGDRLNQRRSSRLKLSGSVDGWQTADHNSPFVTRYV